MKTLFSLPVRRSAELGAFNPALPTDGSLVVADVLRDQFNGLAAMIDAIASVNAAQIDGVQTLLPNAQAFVTLTVTNETLHFTFGIPRGYEGVQGQTGQQGPVGQEGSAGAQGIQGIEGVQGPQGPEGPSGGPVGPQGPQGIQGESGGQGPAGSTGAVGEQGVQGDQGAQGIQGNQGDQGPQGNPGEAGGPPGPQGPTGADGAQGPPGEVTSAALAGAISGTSANSNSVATLNLVVSDPPTQTEMQQVVNKLDELITALRR